MQIAFQNGYADIHTNKEIEVMGTVEDFLAALGLECLEYSEKTIPGEELYTNLLVPPLSGIRQETEGTEETEETRSPEPDRNGIAEIFLQKYGCLPQTPAAGPVSTTTAILLNEYLKGRIRKSSFCSQVVTRKHKKMRELEILLVDATLEEGEELLLKILSLFTEAGREFVVSPTWFSWASMAENIREEGSREKWGAIGALRPEIIASSSCALPEKVVILGIPIAALAHSVSSAKGIETSDLTIKTIEKIETIEIEKAAMKYLCVKYENGRIAQYRNPDLWEQYSETAFERLCVRIREQREPYDYWEIINKVSIQQCNTEEEAGISAVYAAMESPENVNAMLEKVDTGSIERKLGVRIRGVGDSIQIATTNREMLFRCTLMLLCDVWDVDGKLEIRCNPELAGEFSDYMQIHSNRVIPMESSVAEHYSKIASICGYRVQKGGICPQPYRLDTVIASDAFNSLHSMKMAQEDRRLFTEGKKARTLYSTLKEIQHILRVKKYGWEDPEEKQRLSSEPDIEVVRAIEKNGSDHRYPHRSYMFTNMDSGEVQLLVWGCGSVKMINEIAGDIREIFDLVSKKQLEWPQCGQDLRGSLDGKEIARMQLSEYERDKWIVWGKINLSCMVLKM